MAKPPVPAELEALAALREPNRRRLYEYVERQPRAVSRDEAAEALGISRALAAFHLDKLVALSLLKPEYRRLSGRTGPGAGRSSKLYRRSRHRFAVSLPQRNHELLARLLAASSDKAARTSPDDKPAREYGRSLGLRVRKRIRGHPELAQQLKCVEAALESLGFEPYRASPTEMRLRNCPFDPLSRLYTPLVCGIGQALISGIVQGVGADLLHVGRDEQPDRCCGLITLPPHNEAAGA
ncbi:MAG: transcriptional regulator [Actinomycetota bacterium]|nr:transcriptional regulator [Actinomycetota bacterium]